MMFPKLSTGLLVVTALMVGCESQEEVRTSQQRAPSTFGYVESQPGQAEQQAQPAVQRENMWVDQASTGQAPQQQQQQQPNQARAQAANQAGQARAIEIAAQDYAYEPNEIRVTPGTKINLTLRNTGDSPHSIEFELPSGEAKLDNPIQPGQTASLEVTAPDNAGEYTFYCPVRDHRERGMTGKLIVERGQPQPASGNQPQQ